MTAIPPAGAPRYEQTHKVTVGAGEYNITHLHQGKATKASESAWNNTSNFLDHIGDYLQPGTNFNQLFANLATKIVYISPDGIRDIHGKVLAPWAPGSGAADQITRLVEATIQRPGQGAAPRVQPAQARAAAAQQDLGLGAGIQPRPQGLEHKYDEQQNAAAIAALLAQLSRDAPDQGGGLPPVQAQGDGPPLG
jgi:hypothetical protein